MHRVYGWRRKKAWATVGLLIVPFLIAGCGKKQEADPQGNDANLPPMARMAKKRQQQQQQQNTPSSTGNQ